MKLKLNSLSFLRGRPSYRPYNVNFCLSLVISALLCVKKKKLVYLAILSLFSAFLSAQIAFYGDTRTNPETHRQIVAEIAKHQPRIVFHTGDLNSKGIRQREYDSFRDIISPLTQSALFYPARGNHEKDLQLFLENFPQLNGNSYYTVEYDGIRFIVLDSVQDLKPGSQQYKWLVTQLTNQTASILILHHPVFSSGEHGDELGLQLFLPKMLEGSGVKAVFCGHDHNYERSQYKGIEYVVTGGGGAPLREEGKPNPYSVVFAKTNNYLIAEREGSDLHLRVYDLGGDQLDSFYLKGCFEP